MRDMRAILRWGMGFRGVLSSEGMDGSWVVLRRGFGGAMVALSSFVQLGQAYLWVNSSIAGIVLILDCLFSGLVGTLDDGFKFTEKKN